MLFFDIIQVKFHLSYSISQSNALVIYYLTTKHLKIVTS